MFHNRSLALALALCFGVAACSPTKDDAAVADSASDSTAALAMMQVPTDPVLPPDVKKQPASFMRAFYVRHAARLASSQIAANQGRHCVGGPDGSCDLRAVAMNDLRAQAIESYPTNGRWLAAIWNVGTSTERDYRIPPNDTMLVFGTDKVVQDPSGQPRRRVLTYLVRAHVWGELTIRACPPHPIDPKQMVAFQHCPSVSATADDKDSLAHSPPLWTPCGAECCTVQ